MNETVALLNRRNRLRQKRADLQSSEEFRKDYPACYQRLVDSGELEKYLVDAPAPQMTRASRIPGLTSIAIGLTLLALLAISFFGR